MQQVFNNSIQQEFLHHETVKHMINFHAQDCEQDDRVRKEHDKDNRQQIISQKSTDKVIS